MRDRRIAIFGALVLVLLAVLGFANTAGAATTHVYDSSFNAQSPTAIGVDEATGSVYVAGEDKIHRFDANGTPSDFPALGTNEIDVAPFFDVIRTIAVDNSGGINNGAIYVGHENENALVYLANGEFVTAVTRDTFNEEVPNAGSGLSCATAVDAAGNFYVMHSSNGFTGNSFLDKFHPGEWIAGLEPPQDWPVSASMGGYKHAPGFGASEFCKLAVDSTGAIYAANSPAFGSGPIRKYAASTFSLNQPPFKVVDNGINLAVDGSTNELYSDRVDSIARFDEGGDLVESFATGEFEFSPSVAVNSVNGNVYVPVLMAGGEEKAEVRIYRAVTTPDIEDVSVLAGQTVATISAQIGRAGAGQVTGCTIEYGTTTNYGSTAPCSPDPSGTAYGDPEAITAALGGLAKETTYHYRIAAGNADATNRDIDRTFTTHNVADVTTEEPTDVTQTSATLQGSYTGDGDATTVYFEWGPTDSYGNQTDPVGMGATTGRTETSKAIEGLTVYGPESDAYHVRLVATNSSGTSYGPDLTFFSAPPDPPRVSGTTVAGIGETEGTFEAAVNPAGGDTVFTFEYGTTTEYEAFTPISESIGNDEAEHAVSRQVSGLTPATTYHFRVVATNFGGTTNGPDLTFTTPGPPSVLASSANSVTETTAHLSASIVPNLLDTTYRFEYGPSSAYGASTSESQSIGSDFLEHAVAADLAGLAPGTRYHFRVVATNATGTTAGADRTFSTVSRTARPETTPPRPKKCKRGFVKKRGKCVKKKKKHGQRKQGRHGKGGRA